jgi:hypothetical protein
MVLSSITARYWNGVTTPEPAAGKPSVATNSPVPERMKTAAKANGWLKISDETVLISSDPLPVEVNTAPRNVGPSTTPLET